MKRLNVLNIGGNMSKQKTKNIKYYKYVLYEQKKQELQNKILTPSEYESQLKKIIKDNQL